MKCVQCGQELSEGAAFCPCCGKKVGDPANEAPIYRAEVKGLLKSGTLLVYPDRVEFISSSVQKTVFNYSALVSVKKGLDRIVFLTEDGRSESCMVNRKHIHEAFLYIEQASKPYIDARSQQLKAQGVYYSFASGQGLTSGILNLMADRAEFKGKSGQTETVSFQDVKSVHLSMGTLDFSLRNGTVKSFNIGKELRDEVLAFAEQAVAPYIAKRKEDLLAQGIYFSFLSSQGPDSGTLNILEDRVEYASKSGQTDVVFFQTVRAVRLAAGTLELSLTDGTAKLFTVERDVWDEVLAFVERAIEPYVLERTVGFDTSFGIDERIEVNETRGVFHILRQGGREISDPYPLEDLERCEWVECSTPDNMLGGMLSGGMAILNKAVGTQGTPKPEDTISYVGVVLTLRAVQEPVRFGDFLLGMSKSNKKYDRYIAEISRFRDYLAGRCPACEWVDPPEPVEPEVLPALEPVSPAEEVPAAVPAPAPAHTAAEADQFGIIKYIEGVSGFIDGCTTPMAVAMQGSWGNGEHSIMKMLSSHLEEQGQENLFWLHTWQFSQVDSGDQLPVLVGNRLISQLSGVSSSGSKDRALKVAKGLIGITSGFLSQGSSSGQDLMDGLFQDSSSSLERLVNSFSEQVRKRAESGKVIIFIDDLDRLPPAKAMELLEATRNFFDCEGCVFVVTVDYSFILRGARERYGQEFDEAKGKLLFDKLFQVSFRVPVSGYDIQNYVKDKLSHMEIQTDVEAELERYAALIRYSVGCEPKSMDRLFNSFLLLKMLDNQGIYANPDRRLMLFSLLCMQTKFHDVYDFLVRIKDKLTPNLLSDLHSEGSEVWDHVQRNESARTEFGEFARIFCAIINSDQKESISESECRAFAEVLDFSSITSK